MWKPVLSISLGSDLGALLRWGLGNQFNSISPTVRPGTLAANLIGGLTTFSTFSAEVVTLSQQGRVSWAMGAIAIHVSGSLLATLLGLASWQWLRHS